MKITPSSGIQKISYTKNQWAHLTNLRKQTTKIMALLIPLNPIVHGSVARGDVTSTSDIDIMIPHQVSEYQVQIPLDELDLTIEKRLILQATPLAAIKAHLVYTDNVTISFPLVPLYPREIEFYNFGGALNYSNLVEDVRVPGISKALQLITPTATGHLASDVMGASLGKMAKTLNISPATIQERIRVLQRRDKLGRTGVFLREELSFEESFGQALNRISNLNPATRRRIRGLRKS